MFAKANQTPKATVVSATAKSIVALQEEQLQDVSAGQVGGLIATPKWYVSENAPNWVIAHGASAGYDVVVIR